MADNIATEVNSAPQPPALSATSDVPVVTPTPAPEARANAAPDATEAAEAAAETTGPEDTRGETGEGEGEAAEQTAAPAKPDRSLSGRLSQRTRERNELREQNERLAGLLEKALERLGGDKPAPTEAKTETAPPPPEPRPKREQFDDPDAYDEALVQWSSRQSARVIAAEVEARERQAREQAEAQARDRTLSEQRAREAENWQRQLGDLKADPQYADFDDVAFNPDLTISQAIVPLVAKAGPKVLYWLGQNPAEAERISKLDPLEASFEIGAIRHRVENARPARSKAPPPVDPVRGENRATQKTPDEETMEEYAARRLPQLQEGRRNTMFGNRTH